MASSSQADQSGGNAKAIATFDPVAYKDTTREQWQSAADAWNAWGPFLRSWLGPATETMLDMATLKAGDRVLDVAAGAGDQTLQAAERVGPTGYVLATDISPAILAFAKQNADADGYGWVATQVADGENLSVGEATFDLVMSRVGMIYFPDQQAALKAMMSALKPDGRVAAIVYATPERNGFFSRPVGIIRERAALPPPLPGQPGPFSLGAEGVLAEVFRSAGLRDINVANVSAPLHMASAAECVRFQKESFGALHQMMSSLNDAEKDEVWGEIGEALSEYETVDGFVGPCEMVIAVGQT